MKNPKQMTAGDVHKRRKDHCAHTYAMWCKDVIKPLVDKAAKLIEDKTDE